MTFYFKQLIVDMYSWIEQQDKPPVSLIYDKICSLTKSDDERIALLFILQSTQSIIDFPNINQEMEFAICKYLAEEKITGFFLEDRGLVVPNKGVRAILAPLTIYKNYIFSPSHSIAHKREILKQLGPDKWLTKKNDISLLKAIVGLKAKNILIEGIQHTRYAKRKCKKLYQPSVILNLSSARVIRITDKNPPLFSNKGPVLSL